MRLAGICDTDLQLARGYMGFCGIPGHEFVGEVVEATDTSWLGQRVVADINAGCGQCSDCTERDGHHCATRRVLGILGASGAFAESLVVPERCLVSVPASVSDEQAVFAEPLAAALHVLDAVAERPTSVAVLGDGKLGLLIALALHSADVPVTAIGHHQHKLALLPDDVRSLLERDLADERFGLVVEATGSERGFERALSLVEPRGTLVLKTTVQSKLSVDLSPIVINELSIVGSRCGNLRHAVRSLASADIDPRPLIRARYPLTQAEHAFQHAQEPGILKILLEGLA